MMKDAVFVYKSNITKQWILVLDFKDQGEIKLPLEISWKDDEGHENLIELEQDDAPDQLMCRMTKFQLDSTEAEFEHIAFVQHGFMKTNNFVNFDFK